MYFGFNSRRFWLVTIYSKVLSGNTKPASRARFLQSSISAFIFWLRSSITPSLPSVLGDKSLNRFDIHLVGDIPVARHDVHAKNFAALEYGALFHIRLESRFLVPEIRMPEQRNTHAIHVAKHLADFRNCFIAFPVAIVAVGALEHINIIIALKSLAF